AAAGRPRVPWVAAGQGELPRGDALGVAGGEAEGLPIHLRLAARGGRRVPPVGLLAGGRAELPVRAPDRAIDLLPAAAAHLSGEPIVLDIGGCLPGLGFGAAAAPTREIPIAPTRVRVVVAELNPIGPTRLLVGI